MIDNNWLTAGSVNFKKIFGAIPKAITKNESVKSTAFSLNDKSVNPSVTLEVTPNIDF